MLCLCWDISEDFYSFPWYSKVSNIKIWAEWRGAVSLQLSLSSGEVKTILWGFFGFGISWGLKSKSVNDMQVNIFHLPRWQMSMKLRRYCVKRCQEAGIYPRKPHNPVWPKIPRSLTTTKVSRLYNDASYTMMLAEVTRRRLGYSQQEWFCKCNYVKEKNCWLAS